MDTKPDSVVVFHGIFSGVDEDSLSFSGSPIVGTTFGGGTIISYGNYISVEYPRGSQGYREYFLQKKRTKIRIKNRWRKAKLFIHKCIKQLDDMGVTSLMQPSG